MFCISVQGNDSLTIYSGGPYMVNEGKPVSVECKLAINANLPAGSTISLEKQVESHFVKKIVAAVKENVTEIFHAINNVNVSLKRNTFKFTFYPTVEDNGQYRCFCQIYPERGYSNLTTIVVQSNYSRTSLIRATTKHRPD